MFHSTTILALSLAVGFVCSLTVLLEPLYAQEDTTGDAGLITEDDPEDSSDISSSTQEGDSDDISDITTTQVPGGGVSTTQSYFSQPTQAFTPQVSPEVTDEVPEQVPGGVPEQVPGGVPSSVSNGEPNNANSGLSSLGDSAKQFIDPIKEKLAKPLANSEGFIEGTLDTVNENGLLVPGVVAVIAIGGGIAAFSRHHHGRSGSSHSAQYQTQQEDTEEQIYEDVQVVTQGGIEEV